MVKDAEYITDKEVFDPKSENFITLEIWRDPYTGKLFALESEHVASISLPTHPGEISSVYNKGASVYLRSI